MPGRAARVGCEAGLEEPNAPQSRVNGLRQRAALLRAHARRVVVAADAEAGYAMLAQAGQLAGDEIALYVAGIRGVKEVADL